MENRQDHATTCCDWQKKYQDLKVIADKMQKEIVQLKKKVTKENKEVRAHCQHFYLKENTYKSELKEINRKVEVLSNTVIRMDAQLQNATQRIEEMQARTMRKNLIISGIPEPKKETDEQLLESIESFFSTKLKIGQDIPLKTFHRLNYFDASEYRPVLIKVRNWNDKFLILSNATNLKGLKNDKNRYFYINEQLPEKMAEDKKYAQMWIRQNKAKPVNDQLQLKIYKNKLRVNNQPYQKKVTPPSTAEILKIDTDELSAASSARTVYGDSQLVEGSEFISYAVQISKVEDVRMAYRKLRIKYADAAHICSAYRLDPPNGPINQEGNDDGEHGAARNMLNVLQENNILNAAVFIIRFYGGKHIGPGRFSVIKELSKTALNNAGFVILPVAHDVPLRGMRTRSMSLRGRGAMSSAPRGGSQAARPTVDTALSSFRPTPINSPNVSPSSMSQVVAQQAQTTDDEQDEEENENFMSSPEDYKDLDNASVASENDADDADVSGGSEDDSG